MVGLKHSGVMKPEGLTSFRPNVGFQYLGHMGPLETLLGYALIRLAVIGLRTWA
jgi:hypothetical protein